MLLHVKTITLCRIKRKIEVITRDFASAAVKGANYLFQSIIEGTKHICPSCSLTSQCSNLILPCIVFIIIYLNLKRTKVRKTQFPVFPSTSRTIKFHKTQVNWEKKQKSYELFGGRGNRIDHISHTVTLKQTVLIGGRFILKVLHYKALKPLHLLVSCPSHLQQRRRHSQWLSPASITQQSSTNSSFSCSSRFQLSLPLEVTVLTEITKTRFFFYRDRVSFFFFPLWWCLRLSPFFFSSLNFSNTFNYSNLCIFFSLQKNDNFAKAC